MMIPLNTDPQVFLKRRWNKVGTEFRFDLRSFNSEKLLQIDLFFLPRSCHFERSEKSSELAKIPSA